MMMAGAPCEGAKISGSATDTVVPRTRTEATQKAIETRYSSIFFRIKYR